MAVDKMGEYAAQAAAAAKVQQSRPASEPKRDAGRWTETKENVQPAGQGGAVSYEVSQRTNDVAAWYQEFVLKEQEEKLGIVEEEKAEKGKNKDDEEEKD